jgi:alpha-1,3-glucan synthase
LAKFASVQDRLREWSPLAAEKLKKFGCLSIEALDIDGIRIDKATQVTVGFMADWSAHTRECAKQFNKDNFFIPGEITGGDTFGALYIGRGRTPQQRPPSFLDATNMTQDQTQYFLREADNAGLDSSAFHYSVYRSLCRFLGMDGNLNVAYDIDVNFVTAWNQLVVTNDFLNHQTNEFDPRHMFGTTNQDVFRWPSLANGTERGALGIFISTLVLPGMPLLWYGEEQELYLYDNGAANYLYGRQSMFSTRAWQRHGCYRMGSSQYYNMPYDKALTGCDDDWNSLDHFDPTAGTRRTIKQQNFLREQFPSLMDGFNLIQWGNWTYRIQLPGSNVTQTEIGMWSTTRAPLQTQQGQGKFVGDAAVPVWLMYTNENKTTEYTHDCKADEFWISTPYAAPVTVKNLLYPYDEFTLEDSLESYNNDSIAPWRGCLPSITLEPFAFKAFVPVANWVQQHPAITSFTPGHDARILSTGDTIDISLEFDTEMQCASVTQSISITFRGADGSPTLDTNAVCGVLTDAEVAALPAQAIGAVAPSVWRWQSTIRNAPDGIYDIQIDNPRAETVDITTNVSK